MLCTLQVNENSKAALRVAAGRSVNVSTGQVARLEGQPCSDSTGHIGSHGSAICQFTCDSCFSKIINLDKYRRLVSLARYWNCSILHPQMCRIHSILNPVFKIVNFFKAGNTNTHTHTFFACIFLPGPSICWMNEQMNRVHRAWAGKTQTPNSTKEKKRKEKVTFLEQHSRFFHTWEPSVSQYFLKASVRSTLALWWFCFPVLSVSYPTHLLH